MSDWTEDDERIVREEEALLARVSAVLREALEARRHRAKDTLPEQLRELREEAAAATTKELPTLFADMLQVRALMERADPGALPELETPYFAHLRVETARGPRDYLLGHATYADTARDVRIVDWRYAPISRLFYGYQEGDDFEEELPGGPVAGVVVARRVVVIERGVLTRIVAGARLLGRGDDGRWVDEGRGALAGGGAGRAARPGVLGVGATDRTRPETTALLDREQFEALSASGDGGLLVVGSAGSGKTTVALHRLARLAFENPARFAPSRLLVVVPEEGLARLSRRLLDPLGLAKVEVATLERWIISAARATFGTNKVDVCAEPPSLVTKLKRHPALRMRVFASLGTRAFAGASLEKLRQRLGELFSDRTFLGRVVEAADGALPTTCVDETVRHTMQQLATPLSHELAGIDPERLVTIDGRRIEEGTPDELAGTVDVEDLALALVLKAHAGGLERTDYAHVVLDEAEDFSLVELSLVREHLGVRPSVTLAGDELQQTSSAFAGWSTMLATAGVPDASIVRLEVSYRCPRPVTELAHEVLGPLAPPEPVKTGREGAPVELHRFPTKAQAWLFLAEALRDLVDREPRASVGVVAGAPDTAAELFDVLHDLPRTRLVADGRFSFEPGIDVTDVDQIKGLEFDYVVLPDANMATYPVDDESRRRLHVAVTRAAHQLWLVSPGTPTKLVGSAR